MWLIEMSGFGEKNDHSRIFNDYLREYCHYTGTSEENYGLHKFFHIWSKKS